MTREEAIKDIKENIKPYIGGKSWDMAIKALQQLEQKKGKMKCINAPCGIFSYCPNCGAEMEKE